MGFPLTATLEIRRFLSDGVDSHGNDVPVYGDPEPWPVHGYSPGANDEPGYANRDLSLILWTVYAPADALVPRERDLVLLAGEAYRVDGRPSDWTHGPWPFPGAGVSVALVRAEG